jgi:hypothetical protein
MINSLQRPQSEVTCAHRKHRPKGLPRRSGAKAGWTPERRARQAALIRGWQPWRRSTGPKTEAGKARCAMNALKYGYRMRARIEELRKVRYILRLAAQNIELVRLYIRRRDARPRIRMKPFYARQFAALALLAPNRRLASLALEPQGPTCPPKLDERRRKGLGRP